MSDANILSAMRDGSRSRAWPPGQEHPGLSKLTRLVRLFARRFSVQERLGQQLADALERILAPHGVAVHLEAVHLCMEMRGVREIESSTRTTYRRGSYDTIDQLRTEFFELCGPRGIGRGRA